MSLIVDLHVQDVIHVLAPLSVSKSYWHNLLFNINVNGNVVQSFEFLNLTQRHWKFDARYSECIMQILDVHFLEPDVE